MDRLPIIFRREDFCYKCKKENALLLIDKYGNKTNYPELLNHNTKGFAENTQFFNLKCRFCGSEFPINWTDMDRPKPLDKMHYRIFINGYKSMKKY